MEIRYLNPKKEFLTDGGIVVISSIILDGPSERCITGRYKEAAHDDFDINYDLNGQALRENSKWNLDLRVPEMNDFIEAVRELRQNFVPNKKKNR